MLPAKKYQQGLVDPLSLFALGFLVISLFVGTAVVSNPNFTLDIRQRAREIEDEGLSAIVRRPTSTRAPTRAPTPTSGSTAEDRRTERKEAQLEEGLPTATPTTTAPTGATPTPYCTRFNQEDCTYGCEPTTTGGRCKSSSATPIPTATATTRTTTASPTPTPYCSRFNQEDCIYGCEPTTTGGVCKTRTTTATTPTTTPIPTTTTANAYLTCLAQGNTPSECSSILSPTSTPTPVGPTPYCARTNQERCVYGCEPTTTGGRCNLTPTPTPTPSQIAATAPFCSPEVVRDCREGYKCSPTASGGICVFAITAAPTPLPTPSLIVVQPPSELLQPTTTTGQVVLPQFMENAPGFLQAQYQLTITNPELADIASLNPTYNLRLGAYNLQGAAHSEDILGNLVNDALSYSLNSIANDLDVLARIDQSQGPIERAVAAYAVGDIFTLGGLSAIRPAAIGYAEAYANAPEGANFANNPDLFWATVNAGVQGTLFAEGVVSAVGGGAPSQAIQEAYQLRRTATQRVGQYLDDSQRLYAFNQDFVQATGLGNDPVLPPSQTGAQSVPQSVTLESGEIIQLQEQIGSGRQAVTYRGTTCTGETCVVKLFRENNPDYIPVNTAQLEIMRTQATGERIAATGLPSPQYLGTVVNPSGQPAGYAMEFIDGQTLTQVRNAQGGGLTYTQANDLFDTISNWQDITGLPHGDIGNEWAGGLNMDNAILTPEGRWVLIDPAGTSLADLTSVGDFMEQELQSSRYYLQNLITQ